MPVFNKVSSANADLAVRDFLSSRNVSDPVRNLALKRELSSLQAIEKDLSQEDMQKLVSDQLDPYLNAPTRLQMALLGASLGGSVGGLIPLMLRQHAAKVPSLSSLAKRTWIGTGLGSLAGAGIGLAADRLFGDRELRDAYEAGAMKTSEVSGRDVALGGTGLALGAGSAYLGGAGGTALQKALSNQAARYQTFDTMGNVVQFDPKKLELLRNKLKKLDALRLKPSEQTSARHLNLKGQLQSSIDSLLNSRKAQRFQSAADLAPGLSRWGSKVGVLAGGGLLAAAIASAARRNSKTSSDNSSGLMIGGGLGALGSIGGARLGLNLNKTRLLNEAEKVMSSVKSADDVADIIVKLDDNLIKAARKWSIVGGLGTAAGLGALGLGLARRSSKTSSDNSTGLMVGGGLGALGAAGGSLYGSSTLINKVMQKAAVREKALQQLWSQILLDHPEVGSGVPGNVFGFEDLGVHQIRAEAANAARKIARNFSIAGGLGTAAGLGALGLGMYRFNKQNPFQKSKSSP